MLKDVDLEPNPALALEASMRFITEKSNGLLLPYQLFPVLRDILAFEKGAFLLPRGASESFVGSGFCNLDLSSQNRLRLTKIQAQAFKKPKIYNTENLAGLAPLFSQSDFASIKNLTIVPCIQNQKLVAVLVLGNCPYSELEPRETENILHAIAIIVGQGLVSQRTIPSTDMSATLSDELIYPAVSTEKLSKALSQFYLYSSALSFEMDLVSLLLHHLRPYKPLFNQSKRQISALNLPHSEDHAVLLFTGILKVVFDEFYVSEKNPINMTSFILTEHGFKTNN